VGLVKLFVLSIFFKYLSDELFHLSLQGCPILFKFVPFYLLSFLIKINLNLNNSCACSNWLYMCNLWQLKLLNNVFGSYILNACYSTLIFSIMNVFSLSTFNFKSSMLVMVFFSLWPNLLMKSKSYWSNQTTKFLTYQSLIQSSIIFVQATIQVKLVFLWQIDFLIEFMF